MCVVLTQSKHVIIGVLIITPVEDKSLCSLEYHTTQSSWFNPLLIIVFLFGLIKNYDGY